MEHQDKKLEIWREAIPRMNEEDLEFILDFPECFEPKVLRMVKRRYDKITKPEDGEILREMNCSYDFDEDGDIHFEYQDEDFYIIIGEETQFINIWEYGWKVVDLNDAKEVARLRQAICGANYLGDISINYTIREDSNEIHVNCGTRALFFDYIPNRKGYLEYLLDRFFFAHQFLEYKMQQLYEKEHPNERVN